MSLPNPLKPGNGIEPYGLVRTRERKLPDGTKVLTPTEN